MEEVAVISLPSQVRLWKTVQSGLSMSHWLECTVEQKTLRLGRAQLAQAS